MRYISASKLIFIAASLLVLAFIYSCHKEVNSLKKQDPNKNNLAFRYQEFKNSIRIDQAIIIYDSTSIVDSIDYVKPPSDKYYEWKIMPDNGCATITGQAKYGIAQFAFTCSGNYQISATIYDSATHELVATTDTMQVEVTTEKLPRAQAIDRNDTLNIEPSYVMSSDDLHIFLRFATSKSYDYRSVYSKFVYTSDSSSNKFTFNFSDSLKLPSYPFSFGSDRKEIVQEIIDLRGTKVGVPAKVNIRWLGKEYSGTVMLKDQNNVTYEWDNSGAVKFH